VAAFQILSDRTATTVMVALQTDAVHGYGVSLPAASTTHGDGSAKQQVIPKEKSVPACRFGRPGACHQLVRIGVLSEIRRLHAESHR